MMASTTRTMHDCHHQKYKQNFSEMMAYTNSSATFDSYLSDASGKRKRLNPKTFAIRMVEQPQLSALRFVKADQAPSAGSYIVGEKSTIDKETHPGFLLTNVRGPVTIVYYLAADDAAHPHPYILEGEDCENGVCTRTIQAEGQIIQFPGLYVRSVSRREVQKSLDKRINHLKKHLSGVEFKAKDTMEYNLNAVRICFQVLLWENDEYVESLKCLLTRSLRSKEPSVQGEPRILSISQCKGSVHGREELSLQVTNLKTDDVFVLFHHESLEPRTSWQAFADVISISRQKAQHVDIVVHTPPYHNQRIMEPQTVAVQLRLMDNSISNTVKFTYTPQPRGVSRIEHRVKQREPIYIKHFTCLGATVHVDPVLKNMEEEDENEADSSQATRRVKMIVRKLEERGPQTERKRKPLKVDVASQTDERHLRTPDGLEGYDSEEEIGVAEGRVDYDRLYWYRSLMGYKSPPHPENETEKKGNAAAVCDIKHQQKALGMSTVDFSPAHLLDGIQSSTSANSDGSFQAQSSKVNLSNTSSHGSNIVSEYLASKVSLVKLQSQSQHKGEGSSSELDSDDRMKEVSEDSQSQLLTNVGLAKQIHKPQVEGIPEEMQEGSSSDNPVTTEACATTFHKEPQFALPQSLPKFTQQEVVLKSLGADNQPDLSTGSLFPAILHNTQLVAVKEVTKNHFQEEVCSLWHTFQHVNLITLLGVMMGKNDITYIVEFPEKGSLKEYLSASEPQTWGVQLKLINQLAEALHYLHENRLAHQDIRSENCLISKSNDLKLSIPSSPVMARSSLIGETLESDAVLEEAFEKAKSFDVQAYSCVIWEFVKDEASSIHTTKFHMTVEDFQKLDIISLVDDCQKLKPQMTMGEVVSRLLDLYQKRPGTSSVAGVSSITVESPAPDHTLDQQNGINCDSADHLTEFDCEPKTPDSGVYLLHSGIGKGPVRTASNLVAVSEQTDSCVSGESAFSDNSQGSQCNTDAERSVPGDTSNTTRQDTNQTSSEEAGNETNSNPEQQEMEEPDGNQNGQSLNPSGDSTDGGYKDSNGQNGDQNHGANRKENEGLRSHLCPPKVAQRIDHLGGTLTLFDGEIILKIPEGALREGQVEEISLTVDWNDQHVPPLKSTDMSVSPIVQCGPTGLMFEKPVFLKLPHCAVLSNPKHCKAAVYCSNTEEGDPPQWERVSRLDNSDMQVECQDRSFLLHVTHFTDFTIVLEDESETLAKEIMFVAYGKEVTTFEDDQEIRVYLYDFHGSSRENIHQEEQNLSGKQLDGPCSYKLHKLHKGSVTVQADYHSPPWLLVSAAPEVKISFCNVWNMFSWNQCKFTWKNVNNSTQFRCRIVAQQEKNEQVTLEISNHVKISPTSSYPRDSSESDDAPTYRVPTGPQAAEQLVYRDRQLLRREVSLAFSSVDSGQTSTQPSYIDPQRILEGYLSSQGSVVSLNPYAPPPIIPYSLQCSLCFLLDPHDSALHNDWRSLAAAYGYDGHIKIWEMKKSPTRCVLDVIQQERKIESLNDLKECLEKIGRRDAVEAVEKCMCQQQDTRAIQPSEDEPMNVSNTPSPVNNFLPLTASGMFLGNPESSCPNTGASNAPVFPSSVNQAFHHENQFEGRQDTPMPGTPAEVPSRGLQHEAVRQTGAVQWSRSRSPVSPQNRPVTNSGTPQDSHATPEDATPSANMSFPRLGGTHTDENRNVENLEQGVKRMLFSDT